MPSQSLVSVIVTTRNNEATLDKCLESICKQNYVPNLELIVIDNASTDATKKIAKKYTKHVFDKGPERSTQRNYGVEKAKGDYILIIDSDMELPPTIISECVKACSKSTKAAIIPETSFGEGFWAQCKALERSFYVGVDWIEAPRFFSKQVYLQAGGYDETMAGGEDWDLSNRVKTITKIAHTKTSIMHNEGYLTLRSIVDKRRYYTKGFNNFYSKDQNKKISRSPIKQAIDVYILFLSHPLKLLKKPTIGLGMLTMKTLEFGTLKFNSIINN